MGAIAPIITIKKAGEITGDTKGNARNPVMSHIHKSDAFVNIN